MVATHLSNYPGGFRTGLSVRNLPMFETYAGNIWWVSSTRGSNGNKGTRDKPFATIAYAMTRAVASNNDVILAMPYHAETITAAAGIAHNLAGVSVIGLGVGVSRPTITIGTVAGATYAITAADAYLENLVFVGNLSNVTNAITTTKAGTTLNGLEFQNAGTNLDFLTPIAATSTTTSDNNDLTVANCRWHTIDTDDLHMIDIVGTISRTRVYNNFMVSAGTVSPFIKVATGKLLLGADIGWNRVVNAMTANELFISNDGTTNTGIIHNNYVGHADVTGTHDAGWDGDNFRLFNNLSTSVDNLSGFVFPAIDVNL